LGPISLPGTGSIIPRSLSAKKTFFMEFSDRITFKSILMLLPFCENGLPSKMSALAPPMVDARI
jgi:hypothetical protein